MFMLPVQRLRSILEDIKSSSATSVSALSKKYDVSEMTIRRDLKLLEDQGLITRTHGGAIANSRALDELQFIQKQGIHELEKQQIARYAVTQFVSEGDIITMEGGTTVAGMVAHMEKYRNVTIMTNGLHTLFELQRISTGNTVISTGGVLREVSNTFVGPIAEAHFTEYNATKVFLSATGWTATTGFTDPNMLEIQVKKAMIKSARRIIMLIDSSKFGIISLTSFLNAYAPDVLITDRGIPDDIHGALLKHQVEVHIAN
jgi:DeoR/GlpR family transcriptional regulator of sugar metabolism